MKLKPNLLKRSDIKKTGFLSLTEEGLQMSVAVDKDMREEELWCETPAQLRKAEERASKRSALQVVINPDWLQLADLMTYFQAQQALHKPQDGKGWPYSQSNESKTYDRKWDSWKEDNDCVAEGQCVYLVGFEGAKPVGYAKVRPLLYQFKDGDVDFDLHLDAVYVAPKSRGKGFCLDLSVATAQFAKELTMYVYDACAAEQKPKLSIYGESDGNRRAGRFITQVQLTLEASIELREDIDQKANISRGVYVGPRM